ncbi:MAG: HTH domain-containing protein [Solirubrobacteraceae bacterium]
MGTIQAAALTVLTEADGPLAPRQVRARAQALLGLTVSQDTISSFLSVACRNERSPVVRVQRGLYGIRR